ncbi:MAG TPA: Asp-tRNA(Asn)/Glu-tRNA(Gln) amidotransferase subunit GatB [Candidatus Kapabacteria bacterium]|nr:Asp-tRNA(Asn)/Glu-tRNA(Gln) amidotransferase subunit GatB [Candidatus Kapabacteria bacterium]
MLDLTLLAKYEPVIGLEVHAQMLTKSKAFCSCSTEFGAPPNSRTCPICLGHPGTLPVLNENLVRFIVRMGLATHCNIRERSIFARKNYFYPDLPKGYQISQYETPICHDGWIEAELQDGNMKRIGITRIHMEEDSGKSIHDFGSETLVDLNRAGVPLIEIVSEPDMRSSDEAYAYLTTIKSIVTYLGICDGNMEEGSLRCDANVSVHLRGTEKFGQKTEVKNMNSFRNVQRALEAEIERQIGLVELGMPVIHETMMFDANKGTTRPMRTKEEAHDYRYFPEPDLVPVTISYIYIEETRGQLPELQRERRDRFVQEYSLPKYDADVLTADKAIADFFENTVSSLEERNVEQIKAVSNYLMGDVMRLLTEQKTLIDELNLDPRHLAELVTLIAKGTISNKIAKDLLPELPGSKKSPNEIVEERGMVQVSDDSALREAVKKILANNPDNIAKYKSGKTNLFGFFVGQTMKAMSGKANPTLLNEIVKEELEKV